jgi:hypothetical protein
MRVEVLPHSIYYTSYYTSVREFTVLGAAPDDLFVPTDSHSVHRQTADCCVELPSAAGPPQHTTDGNYLERIGFLKC